MRVLVTGATSLLGAHTTALLAARGDTVTVLQRHPSGSGHREILGDITDPVAVGEALRGQHGVIHLAAKVDVVGPWPEFARTNVEGTRTVVELARRLEVGAMVHVSSPSVAHTGGSLAGAGADPAQPARARGHYARSKAAAELLVLGADGPDLAVTAIRPHLVWGPGDTQLVGRIQQRARSGRLVIVGRGTGLVDTTYIDNAAEALVAALDRIDQARGQALVVTNGEPRPVGELLAAFARAGGASAPIRRVPVAVAWAAGAALEGMTLASRHLPGVRPLTEPPLTRFLAEQLSTAHWFDQRHTRQTLSWTPRVGLDEGLLALASARSRRPSRGRVG